MPLDTEVQEKLKDYAFAHVADENWHIEFFSFLDDRRLSKRLGEEFIATRVLYKMLEGLEASDWLLRAQIRYQVLSYASIYEAVLHHVLFHELSDRQEVQALTEFQTKKRISIPNDSMAALEKHLCHDGKTIIPTYESIGRSDETKVRFDAKAKCAADIGLIEDWLKEELIEFYEARNAIHIHAELRKSMDYQLDLSMRAYRRMQPFKDQVSDWLANQDA